MSGTQAEATTVEEAGKASPPKFFVSVSPHFKNTDTVSKIMWTVVACLLPPLILSVFIFGFQTLIIALVSVASCVGTEYVANRALNRPTDTIRDGSAVITGLLMAYTIPPGVPYWMPILGGVMAIYITKVLMGGIGYNIFNPALIGRAFLVATYPVAMTSAWLSPIRDASVFKYMGAGVDAVSTATPLYVLKHYGLAEVIERFGSLSVIYKDFFLGWRPGCIGESSAFLVLLGGLYLIYKKYVSWHIPVSVIVTVGFLTWVFGGETMFTGKPILAILSGGVILGAFYMATDYVTSPTQPMGKLIFGFGIGALTVLIRLKGGYPEGVCYAILLMNAVAPALDNWFKPKRFAPQPEEGA